MIRVQRLDVQGFRGILKPVPLIFDAKSLLLFGENGTCKSSFVDALERLLTGQVTTLDGRASGLSSERHGPHIHGRDYPTDIALTFNDSSRTIFDLKTDRASLPPAIRSYVAAAGDGSYILRRRQLLAFVESLPRERYDLIRPFVRLEPVEAIEGALREVRDRMSRVASIAKEDTDRHYRELQRLTGIALSREGTESQLTSIINTKLREAEIAPITAMTDCARAVADLSARLVSFGDVARTSRIAATLQSLEAFEALFKEVQLTDLIRAVTALRDEERREATIFYEQVLEFGMKWIVEESRNTCPLCEQPIRIDDLGARLQVRLNAVRTIVSLRRVADEKRERVHRQITSAQTFLRRIDARDLPTKGVLTSVESWQKVLQDVEPALVQDVRGISLDRLTSLSDLFSEDSTLLSSLTTVETALRQELESLPSAEEAKTLLSVQQLIVRIEQVWADSSTLLTREEVSERDATTAAAILVAAETARKEELQAVLEEVGDEIDQLYQRLHPDEGHGGVRLEIRDAVQRSVNLRANFYDRKGEDPRAYYSDAHLDTLGISIFLVLRRWYRRQRPDFDLLILDDVLTSVDSQHSVRLAELLLDEFKDYQLFVTTHDRIWFEHLRDIQARCGVAQVFVNKVIHKWTMEDGPDLREPEDERKALDRLIESGTSEEIAVMSGRLLEHLLQEMRYSLRLSVQAKRGEVYDIGDLWPAFYSTIKKDYPTLYASGQNAFDALNIRWPLRNWIGAHRNTWARNVSRKTAVEFAAATIKVFDLVFCPTCRRFVMPSATPLGQLSCRCGTRIYPAPGKQAVMPVDRQEIIRATQGSLREAKFDTARYLELKRAEAQHEP